MTPQDMAKSLAIRLMEEHVADLEKRITVLQELNTKLTLDNRELHRIIDLIGQDCILDCGAGHRLLTSSLGGKYEAV